jgi:hypothetical protein
MGFLTAATAWGRSPRSGSACRGLRQNPWGVRRATSPQKPLRCPRARLSALFPAKLPGMSLPQPTVSLAALSERRSALFGRAQKQEIGRILNLVIDQAAASGGSPVCSATGCSARTLRACLEKGRRDVAANSITSSARSRNDSGIVRPSALAALRLITNSNFVGCSIGRSAGLAPFKILST